MDAMDAARSLALSAAARGGRAYFVGGYVRDSLLGAAGQDIDVEVHGLTPEALEEALREVGEPLAYGQSFGVYALKGCDLDVALPRDRGAAGSGGPVAPFIGPTEAARRRDFTMNALMRDVLSGELIDPFGGRDDLARGVIRHVDDATFAEDPLRVLRAARFAARFGFTIAPETEALCRALPLGGIARERVEEELKKALVKGRKPSAFFEALRRMDQLDVWFPELKSCVGLQQDPVFHPEGDVWVHTMEVVDRAAAFRGEVSGAYPFMLLALTHDLGKIVTTERVNGRIHAYGHEVRGLPLIETFLRRLTGDNDVIRYVLGMVPLHMRPNVAAHERSALKVTNRMFDQAVAPKDLIYIALADRPADRGADGDQSAAGFLFERLDAYERVMARPFVQGRDLVEAGLAPGPGFSGLLEYAHKLRLAGVDKASALKQTLNHAKKDIGGVP